MVFYPFSFLGFFCPFWENVGYVAINSHIPCIYGGRNNDVLDQFGGNLIVKFKMDGKIVGFGSGSCPGA